MKTYTEDRGYPPYDPVMMTALLLYTYCQRSCASRPLAQACEKRVDFMAVTAVLLAGTLQAGCAVALLNASAAGDVGKARRLMNSGHGADERFPLVGTSPLMLAAGHGQVDMLSVLIEAGADVNAADFTGWTALHAAAFQGDRRIVLLLLEHGAVPSESRWFLQSPAEIAETLSHHDLAPLLRRKENQPDTTMPSPQGAPSPDRVDVNKHRAGSGQEGRE